jgi:tetratricopeptide (TPR) repeat protein
MFRSIADPELRTRIKTIITCVAIVLMIAGSITGYVVYKPWRLQTLTREARAAFARDDYTEASLKARRTLQIDSAYLPGCILLAEIAEKGHNVSAVDWRERVAVLSGGSTNSLIAHASTAFNFGKQTIAKRALNGVPEADRVRPDYQAIAGAVALGAGNVAEAERFFREAARLDPQKVEHRFNLGRAQVSSPDYFTREEGRRLLSEMGAHPEFGIAALRALIASYESHDEPLAALRESERLVREPGHTFPDEIIRLRLLRAANDKSFASALAAAQEKAAENALDAGALIVWMNSAGLASDALDWAQKRAPQVAAMADVTPALASCYLTLGDWPTLLTVTKKGPWGNIDYIRHAYRAKALREGGNQAFARTEWTFATTAAARQPQALAWLARVSLIWKWSDEAEKVHWAVLEQTPNAFWAIERLRRQYLAENNTAGLRRLSSHLIKVNPADEDALNDFAMGSLLLGKEGDKALEIARELHKKHPENVNFTSTYAFALHCANRSADALSVLDSLPSEQLEQPAFAAYYGIVLSANHIPDKARRFLAVAEQGALLPEEWDLVKKAAEASADVNPPADDR